MREFSIAPYALPNCEAGEVRFEESRDVIRIVVSFSGPVPAHLRLFYLQKHWPSNRLEFAGDNDEPFGFGWVHTDDWFNGEWRHAEILLHRKTKSTVEITFKKLSAEKDIANRPETYDVEFRRTLGLKLETADLTAIRGIEVYTVSQPGESVLNVELDAGRRTPSKAIGFEGYNAEIEQIAEAIGASVKNGRARLNSAKNRGFKVHVRHMKPAFRFCGDEGLVTFILDNEKFTVSLSSLDKEGPVWFAEMGIYVTKDSDTTTFKEYREKNKLSKTLAERVASMPEQSLDGALRGQPRPHPTNFPLGCKLALHKFWLEPNGDVCLHRWYLVAMKGKDLPRFKNQKDPTGWWGAKDKDARFFFGLEQWKIDSRASDPAPVIAYTIQAQKDTISVKQKTFAAPLRYSILEKECENGDEMVLFMKFTFRNFGTTPAAAEIPMYYSQNSRRSLNNDVPASPFDVLTAENGRIFSDFEGSPALRCTYSAGMECVRKEKGIAFSRKLQPGESCELLLKIPYIALDTPEELSILAGLDYDKCYREVTEFWLKEGETGARLHTPEPRLNALYKAHYPYVSMADFKMDDGLVNTSVGSSTYGNFTNESCMIIQELDQRGLHEEARRRLDIYVKYQGTVKQPGNFTDFEGMYFGAGGFEMGSYNQHHGWALWCICHHYFLSGDAEWFKRNADSVVKGADWIFRQRKNTMKQLPHSRGWEYGFLPAGSLEDVTDFYYWLSTNVLTWRGSQWAARALQDIGHPEVSRIRQEADAFRRDLIHGFEILRQHSPLVRLRNGEWVPHYPTRLYCRGRGIGWIREVLEGPVYFMISGLYASDSKQARWILNDLHDNLYCKPPYGYLIPNFESNWFNRAGFSCQPNLLEGLLPHLDRDETEVYLWMFFNAWVSCYREEINAMIEHPAPVLGYANSVAVKTADEANAIKWLRYMLVWANDKMLHLGRAIPRAWFKNGQSVSAEGVATLFGKAGITYHSEVEEGRISAAVELSFRKEPSTVLVRFRHPEKLEIKSASVNGKKHTRFDSVKGDVDISGLSGKVVVEVNYK